MMEMAKDLTDSVTRTLPNASRFNPTVKMVASAPGSRAGTRVEEREISEREREQ